MSWYTEDDGGPVAELDDVFRNGFAPKLHGMLKRFNEANIEGPVYIDEPWSQAYEDRELKYTSNFLELEWRESRGGSTYHPILQGSAHSDGSRDLTIEEFFHHANILTGQDIGSVKPYGDRISEALEIQSGGWISTAVEILEDTRASGVANAKYDDLDIFGEESAWWGDNWTDKQGRNAKERCKRIDVWDGEYRREGLSLLSSSLVRFGAIVHGARLDLNNLMGECVEHIESFDAETGSGPLTIGWRTLSGIANVASSGWAAPIVAVNEMQSVLNDERNSMPSDGSAGYYGTLYRFLEKANQLLTDTVHAVDTLTKSMVTAFDNASENGKAPSWKP